MTFAFLASRVHCMSCVGLIVGLVVWQAGSSWGENLRGAVSQSEAQRPEEIRKQLQNMAKSSILLLDTFLAMEKSALSQAGAQRPEDVRKELFEAFGGVPRIQKLHTVATKLKQHGLDDEARQLLQKSLAVARWGGQSSQPLIAELLRTLAQFHMAPGRAVP